MSEKIENALTKLPYILNVVDDDEKTSMQNIFANAKSIIDYDIALVYYVNDERLTLKYKQINKNEKELKKPEDVILLDKFLKKNIFETANSIENEKSAIIKNLKLQIKNASYIVTKLYIKSVIFGVLILIKKDEPKYEQEDLKIAQSLGSVVSYAIKDVELSNVFKLQ